MAKAQSQYQHMVDGITLYNAKNHKLIARDCKIELPDLTPVTAEIQAAGKMKVPDPVQYEDITVKITIPGHSDDIEELTPAVNEELSLEARWSNKYVDTKTRRKKQAAHKVFMRGDITKYPGDKLEVATVTENEYEMSLSFFCRMKDSKTVDLIDRYNLEVIVNGKNLYAPINALL